MWQCYDYEDHGIYVDFNLFSFVTYEVDNFYNHASFFNIGIQSQYCCFPQMYVCLRILFRNFSMKKYEYLYFSQLFRFPETVLCDFEILSYITSLVQNISTYFPNSWDQPFKGNISIVVKLQNTLIGSCVIAQSCFFYKNISRTIKFNRSI